MSSINLWEETIEVLKENDLEWEDVYSIGTKEGFTPKEVFRQFAKKYNYDNGYGIEYVPLGLVIEGKGFRMVREEYDGAEWWKVIKFESSINIYDRISNKDFKMMFRDTSKLNK